MQSSAGVSSGLQNMATPQQMASMVPSTQITALLSPNHVSQMNNTFHTNSNPALNMSSQSVFTPTGDLPPLMGNFHNAHSQQPTPSLKNMSSPELMHLTGGHFGEMSMSPYAQIPGPVGANGNMCMSYPSPAFPQQRYPGARQSMNMNKKKADTLSQAEMKKLYNSIDKTTIPVTGPQGQNMGTQGNPVNYMSQPPSRKGSEMSLGFAMAGKGQIGTPASHDVSTTITPRSDLPAPAPVDFSNAASDPFSVEQAKGNGKGAEVGLQSHELAQQQGMAKELKQAAQMTVTAEGTHMPTSFRQVAMGDQIGSNASGLTGPNGENLTFLEDRKRHFSRQKQQAVFHYTLRHAKQYSKQPRIAMSVEWCFRQLEEKRKVDLMNGIRNPIAELAQRTDLTEEQRRVMKGELEKIKKEGEITFLIRQKELAESLGMSDPSSQGSGNNSIYNNYPSSVQQMPQSDPFSYGQKGSSHTHTNTYSNNSRSNQPVSNSNDMNSHYASSVTHSQMYGLGTGYETLDSMSLFYENQAMQSQPIAAGKDASGYMSGYQYM